MKRVVRSKSGREIYGPKWLISNNNMESENEKGDAHALDSASVETTVIVRVSDAAAPETNVVDDEDQTSIGIYGREIHLSDRHETMYRATLEDDWLAAEMLLEGDPKLVSDEISEEGDRALHVAASMKHKDFVLKLVERMSPSELEMVDGRGYTACCYAAISGSVEIADLMIRKSPTLATARDRVNKTPLHKAALSGNTKMVSYLLKSSKIERLSRDEWFDLLLATIRRRMFDAALEISGIDEELATMRNDEGTALHLLAKQPFAVNVWGRISGVMRPDMMLLARKLLAGIQKLGQASVIEVMKNPSILHDAAEEGNVELITMLTHAYPNLVYHTNNKGYTIFHIAANCRYNRLFELIDEIGVRKDLIAMSQDEDGNNILHLAAELEPPERGWTLMLTAFEMQRKVVWFKRVMTTVPRECRHMRNKEGHTPAELFSKRHERLLEESRTWIRNTADSCMLISTLIFSVVFASTFAVPGGYNQDTGIPVLYKENWFTCFVIFEALAMFSSALCLVCFLRNVMTDFREMNFVSHLPNWFLLGINALIFSVFGAISTFMSAYYLVYAKERAALVKFVIVFVYVVLVCVFCFFSLLLQRVRYYIFPKQTRHTLFKRNAHSAKETKRRFWIF